MLKKNYLSTFLTLLILLTLVSWSLFYPSAGFGQVDKPTVLPAMSQATAANQAVALAVGDEYTCALTASSGVKCWGRNAYGTLGDGTTTDRTTPVDVVGLTSGVQAIAGSFSQTCAQTSDGAVQCWGNIVHGTGIYIDAIPVEISGWSGGVQRVAPGKFHICALTGVGGVQCLGFNNSGEVGQGDEDPLIRRNWHDTPVEVLGLGSGLQTVAAGFYYNCALTAGQSVVCWGNNSYGQLGDGTTTERRRPTAVSGLSAVQALAPHSAHTCALLQSGGVTCWGENSYGQLGDGTTSAHLTPVDVLITGVQSIATGSAHSCAVLINGGVNCWGWNAAGQLGDGTMTDRLTPVAVIGLESGVSAIAAGFAHTCALMTTGEVKCWGGNTWGQLGNGETSSGSSIPIAVIGFGASAPPTPTPTPSPTSQPGDGNGDGQVDAGDITACVLEIFDGDGAFWLDASGGTFPGTSGCDANTDTTIDAGDLACTVLLIFNGQTACVTASSESR